MLPTFLSTLIMLFGWESSKCVHIAHICIIVATYNSETHSFVPDYLFIPVMFTDDEGKILICFLIFRISPLDACAKGECLTDTHFHCVLNKDLDCLKCLISSIFIWYEYTKWCVESRKHCVVILVHFLLLYENQCFSFGPFCLSRFLFASEWRNTISES